MREILAGHKFIAVVTIENSEDAIPLAESLLRGGVKFMEVTLRTTAAREGIRQIICNMPDITDGGVSVGIGTIFNKDHISIAESLGCKFMASPGLTNDLLRSANKATIPLLPGVSSASEIMTAMEYGYNNVKFFPAEASGGSDQIKSLGGPFPDVQFCPTGGIGLHNIERYLELPNVFAVGGSWIAPHKLIRDKRWGEIEALASEAISICGS